MMVRLFGNKKSVNHLYGTLRQNGTGKFADITEGAPLFLATGPAVTS
ncbi:MAG: hypothetical protein ACE5JX_07020 [Acidobacteriota bacterium]